MFSTEHVTSLPELHDSRVTRLKNIKHRHPFEPMASELPRDAPLTSAQAELIAAIRPVKTTIGDRTFKLASSADAHLLYELAELTAIVGNHHAAMQALCHAGLHWLTALKFVGALALPGCCSLFGFAMPNINGLIDDSESTPEDTAYVSFMLDVDGKALVTYALGYPKLGGFPRFGFAKQAFTPVEALVYALPMEFGIDPKDVGITLDGLNPIVGLLKTVVPVTVDNVHTHTAISYTGEHFEVGPTTSGRARTTVISPDKELDKEGDFTYYMFHLRVARRPVISSRKTVLTNKDKTYSVADFYQNSGGTRAGDEVGVWVPYSSVPRMVCAIAKKLFNSLNIEPSPAEPAEPAVVAKPVVEHVKPVEPAAVAKPVVEHVKPVEPAAVAKPVVEHVKPAPPRPAWSKPPAQPQAHAQTKRRPSTSTASNKATSWRPPVAEVDDGWSQVPQRKAKR